MSTRKNLIQSLPTAPGNTDLDPPLDLSIFSPHARPDVAGAVGGKASPSTSRFDEAAAEADLDFQNNELNPSNQPTTNQLHQSKPYERYFKGDTYPRYLVIKHQDPKKNIATVNKITVGNGLREIVKNKHYPKIKIKTQYNSRLLLIEVDEKQTAERLLEARKLQTIPIKVEVHQSKNTCKGVIFNDYFEYSDKEMQQELQSQLVTEAFRITNSKGEKTKTIILTFCSERLPPTVRFCDHDDLSTKVYPYKEKPRQCTSCLVFGHGPKFCKKVKLCHKCAEPADHRADACPNPVRCFNCEGDHSALSHDCPLYTIEEAVISQKELTRADIETCRNHVIRTHSLVDRIPKLKERRDKLPRLLSQVVAGATGHMQNARPLQRGPQTGQTNLAPPPQNSDMEKNILSEIRTMLAPLASIPQQLTDLKDTMTLRVDSHEKAITTLLDTVNNIQEKVDTILQIPMIQTMYNDEIAKKQAQASKGASPATGDGRKSRSRGREQRRRGSSGQRRRGSSAGRSKTPSRTPMEQEPSTPSRGVKRRNTEPSPPSSPEANKERVPPPKETQKNGCDTIPPSVKKAHRPSSTEDARSLREEEPIATPPAPEQKPATTPESTTKPGNVSKGGRSRSKTGLKAGKLPSKTPNR